MKNFKTQNPTGIQIFTSEVFGEIRTCQLLTTKLCSWARMLPRRWDTATRECAEQACGCRRQGHRRDSGHCLMELQANTLFINESGLYSLILSSKLEQAKEFKRWVTSEVLPQIRMTGGYIPTKDAQGRQLSDEEIVERAHEIVGRTLQLLNSKSEYCLTATQVAASWGMDVLSFNNLLASMGIQKRRGGRWQLCDELQGKGLTEVRYFYCFSLKGKQRKTRYMVWTPKGVDFLNMMVRKMPREITANVQLNFCF